MEAAPGFSGRPEALSNLYVPTSGNIARAAPIVAANPTLGGGAAIGSAVSTTVTTLVPLSTIAHWNSASANASVSHSNGEPLGDDIL